ncbi:MAG TPA: anti-sigma factor [Candidatus Aquabacterium excrementipullorum]|nr:anti-sigma factor [Candidatus Aquabacterium excrementipullorum]
MDYSRSNLADRLAADYVVGTLRGPARRRFEALIPAHPALRNAVDGWQRRLGVLSADITPVEPSADVWARIQQRLFSDLAKAPARWWQRLGVWQGWAATATVAALALGVLLSQPTPPAPPTPPIVVVMSAPDAAKVAAAAPQFVASVSGDGRSLVIKPLAGTMVPSQKALELWALAPQGAPRSLGIVSNDKPTVVLRGTLLKDTTGFALTIEPPGGAPGGKATGPVVSVGMLQT